VGQAGRPARLNAVSRLMPMLAEDKSQVECARALGVSRGRLGAPWREGREARANCSGRCGDYRREHSMRASEIESLVQCQRRDKKRSRIISLRGTEV
jgi:hypothetical protein